jgi:hypothetical protein
MLRTIDGADAVHAARGRRSRPSGGCPELSHSCERRGRRQWTRESRSAGEPAGDEASSVRAETLRERNMLP